MIDVNQEQAHETPDPAAGESEMSRFLAGIQGNILKGHGRNIAFHIFVRFTKKADDIRATLIPLAKRVVTSAKAQLEQTRDFHALEDKDTGRVFGSLLLSSSGYAALGFEGRGPFAQLEHRHFYDGMRSDYSRAKLGDPAVADWERLFRRGVDLLVILAGDDDSALEKEVSEVMGELEKIGIPQAERGDALWTKGEPSEQQSLEPFGFVDGTSQPLFFRRDLEKVNHANWNPLAPLSLVLTQDLGVREPAYGSFCVFRKLEQNVAEFQARERALEKQLGVAAGSVGASVIGRLRDGTPLHLSNQSNPELGKENDFTYGNASTCPLHAHSRKANPRRDADRGRRIVRRGIPYGQRPGDDQKAWSQKGSVGLLFACYQANIDNQFAFIQRLWLNDPNFPAQDTGEDPLVSHGAGGGPQRWVNGQGKADAHRFGRYVTMKGGEFFFAPSMAFLSKFAPE